MQRAIVVAIAVLALSSSLRCGGEPSATDEQNSAAGAGGSGGSPPLGAVPRPAYAYPSADPDVCFVPTADKLELQNVLDNVSGACPSHKLRLEGGDYRTGGLPELVIRSGYELYGLPGIDQTGAPPTSVPPIRIAGGTERAVLSTRGPISSSSPRTKSHAST